MSQTQTRRSSQVDLLHGVVNLLKHAGRHNRQGKKQQRFQDRAVKQIDLRTPPVRYECTLDGESYVYEASYNSQYQVLYEGGDAWISNHVRPEQYEDVNVLSAQMQDYFEEKGGTCTIIDENP